MQQQNEELTTKKNIEFFVDSKSVQERFSLFAYKNESKVKKRRKRDLEDSGSRMNLPRSSSSGKLGAWTRGATERDMMLCTVIIHGPTDYSVTLLCCVREALMGEHDTLLNNVLL